MRATSRVADHLAITEAAVCQPRCMSTVTIMPSGSPMLSRTTSQRLARRPPSRITGSRRRRVRSCQASRACQVDVARAAIGCDKSVRIPFSGAGERWGSVCGCQPCPVLRSTGGTVSGSHCAPSCSTRRDSCDRTCRTPGNISMAVNSVSTTCTVGAPKPAKSCASPSRRSIQKIPVCSARAVATCSRRPGSTETQRYPMTLT